MESDIKVSIGCITYNQEDYIENTIKSFLSQKTNFKFEILIHDDASTDRTAEIINEYAEKYPDIIKPLIQKENQYSKGNRRVDMFNHNRAIGKYVALCEGDDYWSDESKLQKQYDYMEKNEDCSLVFGNVNFMDGSTGKIIGRTEVKGGRYFTDDVIKNGGEFMPTATIMYRKKLFDNPPKFFFDSSVGDYPMQMIIVSKGYSYCFEECLGIYRVNAKNSWSSRMIQDESDIDKRVNKNNSYIEMLRAFNDYTCEKYEKSINEVILSFEFEKYIASHNVSIKELNKTKFKVIYENLIQNAGVNQKITLYLKVTSTSRYIQFLKFKNFLKSLRK